MNLETLLATANLLQGSVVVVTLSANVPQWLTLHRNRSSANISPHSWSLWLIASLITFFYAAVNQAAYRNSLALLFTSCVSALCNSYSLLLLFRYRSGAHAIEDDAEPS